jgi:uncharacterized membrane protein
MTPQNQQQQNIQSVGGDTIREQDKIMLVLSYIGILSLIPFLTVKDSPYVTYHAKQGLVLNLAGGLGIMVLSFIPFINLTVCLLGPALFVLDIIAIMKALKGERWAIPVVTDLAAKF